MKTKYIIAFAVAVALLSACRKEDNEIESTANRYLNAMIQYDFDGAGQYGTENTLIFLDEMKSRISDMSAEQLKQLKNDLKNVRVSIVEITEHNDDSATVWYQYLPEGVLPSEEQVQSVDLLKRDGKWLIDETEIYD